MHRLPIFVGLYLLGFGLGCDDEPSCVPGQQTSCPCLKGGKHGVQVCNATGDAFEPCQCGEDIEPQPDASVPAAGKGGAAGGGDTAGTTAGAAGTTRPATAGRGGAGTAGSAGTGFGQPITPTGPKQLAARQNHPTGVTVFDTQVFWADAGDGTVVGCEVAACDEPDRWVVVDGLANPLGVAADDTSLYFLDAGADGMALSIGRCPKAGCEDAEPDMLFSTAAKGTGLAVRGGELFIGAWESLLRCPVDGCSGGDATVLAEGGGIAGVAVDAEYVYFVRSEARAIYRCPLDGGCGPNDIDSVQLTSPDREPLSVATDGAFIYWTTYQYFSMQMPSQGSGPTINNCPASGCSPYAPSTVASGDIAPFGVALDGRTFVWTDYAKGQVTRAARPHDR